MEHEPSRHRYERSQALFARASELIPGGIYGHTSPAVNLPLNSPYYAQRNEGCRYWDVDGNEYIDYMCGYGPMIVGHRNAEVEAAAEAQRALGDCFNHPTPLMVELVERLVTLVDFADWGVLAKNGSDVTTWAIQVAREWTKRPKVLKIRGAYHGVDAWCTPGHGGVLESDRIHIHDFPWNDLDAFERLVKQHGNETAAVIVTPYHHPAFADSVMPKPGFLQGIEAACRKRGIVLILDDIRAGFRLHLGGSHKVFGFTPDLICFCKAMGNGYPISAALGRSEYKVAASKVFLTGSYWNGAVAMAASLKTLEILEREDAPAYLDRIGKRLMDGLVSTGARHGFEIVASGPAAAPFMTFKGDKLQLQQRFCTEMIQLGHFLHPHHNWFLSTAHKDSDIDATLADADRVFALMAQ